VELEVPSQVGPATLLVAGPRTCGETLVLGYEAGGGMEGAVNCTVNGSGIVWKPLRKLVISW